jgi:hypothetical protein
LPAPVLAAIIVSAALQLVNVADARVMWAASKADFAQMILTVAGVLALGIDKGVMVGIGVSLLLVLYRSFQPRITQLGRLPGTSVWVATYRYPQAAQLPGIRVLRLDGELHYGNVARAVDTLMDSLQASAAAAAAVTARGVDPSGNAGGGVGQIAPPPNDSAVTPAVPDVIADEASAEPVVVSIAGQREAAMPDTNGLAAARSASSGESSQPPNRLGRRHAGHDDRPRHAPEPAAGSERNVFALASASSPESAHTDYLPLVRSEEADGGDDSQAGARPAAAIQLRGMILDCGRVVAVDGTACRELKSVIAAYRKAKVPLLFACLPGPVRDRMEAYAVDASAAAGKGVGAARDPYITNFLSVDAAVAYCDTGGGASHTPGPAAIKAGGDLPASTGAGSGIMVAALTSPDAAAEGSVGIALVSASSFRG